MNPLADSLVARGVVACDDLEVEIRRLVKVWRKLDTILRQREPLTETQRKSLKSLVIIVKLYQRVIEGNWQSGDCRSTAELKMED